MMPPTVLVVEDDPDVATAMVEALEEAGFDVSVAVDGPAALDSVDARPVDLVLLDLRLPGLDGFEVCQRIRRRSEVPVVMVTARSDASEIVTGLELGADDYIVKPFEAAVLVARARAVLRRYADDAPRVRAARDLAIDEMAFSASKDGAPLALTAIEMRLLVELVRNQGKVMSREELLEQVWGYGYLGDSRLVDMAIKRLRDKLSEPPADPPYITTVRGVGYRFEDDPEPAAPGGVGS
jgi:two-component system, OmpR family, response regulator MtrA